MERLWASRDVDLLAEEDEDLLEERRDGEYANVAPWRDDYGRRPAPLVRRERPPWWADRKPSRPPASERTIQDAAADRTLDDLRLGDERELRKILAGRPTFAPWNDNVARGGRQRALHDFTVFIVGRPAARAAEALAPLFAAHAEDVEYRLAMVAALVVSQKLVGVLEASPSPALWRAVLEARRRGLFERIRPAPSPEAPRRAADPELDAHTVRFAGDLARAKRFALDVASGDAAARAGKRVLGFLDGLTGGAASRAASRATAWIGDRRVMKRADPAAASPSPEEALAALDPQGGAPLPPEVLARLAHVFGHDFAHVRIHTGGSAAKGAAGLGAQAVTIGSHIFFADGKYAPGTPEGDKLLVHELTHVVQHDTGRLPRGTGGVPSISRPDDASEREARDMEGRADRVADPAPRPARSRAPREPEKGDRASRSLITDGLAAMVRSVQPALADLLEKGPGELLKQTIEPALASWASGLAGTLAGLDPGAAVRGLADSFSSAFAVLRGAKDGDPKCCELLANGVNAVREVATAFVDNPALAAVQGALGRVNDTVGQVAKIALAPAFDGATAVSGGVFGAIAVLAGTIWGWIRTVQDLAGSAVDWVFEQLGFPGGAVGEESVLAWLLEQASELWSTITAAIQPIAGPLTFVIGGIGTLTGLTQIYLIVKYVPKILEAVQWLWSHRNDPDIVKSSHAEMGGTILPALVEAMTGFSAVVQSAASAFLAELQSIGEGVLELAGALTGVPLLAGAKGLFDAVSSVIQAATEWAGGAFGDAAEWIGEVATKAVDFARPWGEVLSSVALALGNPWAIPAILQGWAWRWLPDCIKPPIIDLLLDAVLAYLAAAPELPIFGPLWPLMKAGVVGFVTGLRAQSPDVKIAVSNKIAKILTGASPAFVIGLVGGVFLGLWDGIKEPFEIIWMLGKGLVAVVDFFFALAGLSAAPAAQPAPAPPPASPEVSISVPSGFSPDAFPSVVSGVATTLNEQKPAAPGSAPAPQAGVSSDVASAASRMAADLAAPVQTVSENLMPALQEWLQGGEGMTFDEYVAKLGELWTAAKDLVGAAGAGLATALCNAFLKDTAEGALGQAVGYLVGMILFEIVLEFLSAGTWRGAMLVVSAFAKFIEWPSKFLGEALQLLGKLGGMILDGVKKLASLAAKSASGALKSVMTAFETIGQKLIQFADELAGKAGKAADDAGGPDARKGDGDRDGDGSRVDDAARRDALKASELPQALAVSAALIEGGDRAGVPAVEIASGLDLLKGRFDWIKRFDAEPLLDGGYAIYLIASRILAGKTSRRRKKNGAQPPPADHDAPGEAVPDAPDPEPQHGAPREGAEPEAGRDPAEPDPSAAPVAAPAPIEWPWHVGEASDVGMLKPGVKADKSIAARSQAQSFTDEELDAMDRIGRATGCHTCGVKTPRPARHFTPDHQPPSELLNFIGVRDIPQCLYPHCPVCSRIQGGQVGGWMKRNAKLAVELRRIVNGASRDELAQLLAALQGKSPGELWKLRGKSLAAFLDDLRKVT